MSGGGGEERKWGKRRWLADEARWHCTIDRGKGTCAAAVNWAEEEEEEVEEEEEAGRELGGWRGGRLDGWMALAGGGEGRSGEVWD